MRRITIAVIAAVFMLSAAPAALAGPANSTELLTPRPGSRSPPTANDSAPSSASFEHDLRPSRPGPAAREHRRPLRRLHLQRRRDVGRRRRQRRERLRPRHRARARRSSSAAPTGPPARRPTATPSTPRSAATAQFVAFASRATNLFSTDTGGSSQVYVRDIVDGTTRLVSRATGAAGIVGNDSSDEPSISDDGDVIAFSSFATNLGGGCGAPPGLRPHRAARPKVVSTFDTMTAPGNADSSGAVGVGQRRLRRVHVRRGAGPGHRQQRRDRRLPRARWPTTPSSSRACGAGRVGNSELGRRVDRRRRRPRRVRRATRRTCRASTTSTTPTSTTMTSARSDTEIASVGATFTDKATGSSQASISADGDQDRVPDANDDASPPPTPTASATSTSARSRGPSTALASRCAGGTLLDQPAFQSAIAPSGTRVYFGTASDGCSPDDDNDYFQVFQRVLTLSVVEPTQLISRPTGTGPLQSNTNDSAIHGFTRSDDSPQAISADGRFTAFASEADELSPDDDNRVHEHLRPRRADRHDDARQPRERRRRRRGQRARRGRRSTSRRRLVTLGAPPTSPPAISANGQVVAFTSAADNLVPGDTNDHSDVFVRNLVTDTTTLVSVKTDGSQVNAGLVRPVDQRRRQPRRVRVARPARSRRPRHRRRHLRARHRGRDDDAGQPPERRRRHRRQRRRVRARDQRRRQPRRVRHRRQQPPARRSSTPTACTDVYVRDLAREHDDAGQRPQRLPFAGDKASDGVSLDTTGTHVAFSSAGDEPRRRRPRRPQRRVRPRPAPTNTTTLVSRVAGGNVSGNDDSVAAVDLGRRHARRVRDAARPTCTPGDTDQQQRHRRCAT